LKNVHQAAFDVEYLARNSYQWGGDVFMRERKRNRGGRSDFAPHARRFPRLFPLLLGLSQRIGRHRTEARVARELKNKIDMIVFATAHQRLAVEARVAPQRNAHPRGCLPDRQLRFATEFFDGKLVFSELVWALIGTGWMGTARVFPYSLRPVSRSN
jgi:hypothetical protein